ncbi:heparan-alpha-glucosaminide N-acetyltransferase domain-containing protein [Microbacterium sp. 179-I 3D4 NHS]|uniref:heparan-alpha-glucosaminide N-acetyltransferase domain-containing protein n=1 Tax=Microbacterium sp. 179-I 3D4 NHS TaxID=3142381 RepID=UPI0039A07DE4
MSNASAPARWFHEFGRPPRILGLDVARGLAILGMAGAHIGDTPVFDWSDPATWTDLVHGRSSILFAVLAGVSIALMTGRSTLPAPERLPALRLALVGRGGVIFVIGLALEFLHTPIAVILILYGLLYAAVIPVLRWRPWQLLTGAAVLALAGPPLLALISALTLHPSGAGIGFVLYGSYPITVWLALVLGGMALGRLHVDGIRTAWVALGTGVALAVVGYGLGAVGAAQNVPSPDDRGVGGMRGGWDDYPQALAEADPLRAVISAVFAVEPHSGGVAEILGSGGFALALIALCLLLSTPLRWPMLPFGALGSMPLSAYSGHILFIALLVGPGGFYSSNAFWAALSAGLLVISTAWSIVVGQGPLEQVVSAVARKMSGVSAPPVITGPRLNP